MHHTSTILTQYGVRHWLDYGTLLGAIRDNDIIPWDFDVDFTVPFEDCEKIKESKEAFTKAGYFMYVPGEWIPQKYK
jgi:phosphorylcholine metabolism protein LicD